MTTSERDSILTDVGYALKQLGNARRATTSGRMGDDIRPDECIRRAMDALERVEEALDGKLCTAD